MLSVPQGKYNVLPTPEATGCLSLKQNVLPALQATFVTYSTSNMRWLPHKQHVLSTTKSTMSSLLHIFHIFVKQASCFALQALFAVLPHSHYVYICMVH
jgi:hypothetical protein